MKVKELIVKLQEFDPELPVAVADWQEEYRGPNEKAAEQIQLGGAEDWDPVAGKFVYYDAVVIG